MCSTVSEQLFYNHKESVVRLVFCNMQNSSSDDVSLYVTLSNILLDKEEKKKVVHAPIPEERNAGLSPHTGL